MIIIIPGEFPTLNEIVEAAKTKFPYIKMKKDYTELAGWAAIKENRIESPVEIVFRWYTKDKMKDPDNIAAGQKFILDGFVAAGLLVNDTRKYIKKLTHEFPEPDKNKPRVEVEIKEVA
jgi:Holliday junction resolvase RusA-like endonuclease